MDKYGPAWDGILLELGNYCTPDVVATYGSKYPLQPSFYFLYGVTMSAHDFKLPTETELEESILYYEVERGITHCDYLRAWIFS